MVQYVVSPVRWRHFVNGLPCLLTVRATADRLQVAEKTIRRLITAGELPTHRIGDCVRVSEDDLLVFLSRARQ